MFGFSSPVWLGALAVLAIPIALHLWSRRPTRVVRVGSLRHLEGPRGPRAWGRRLDDIPLLLVRAAVLTAAVLGLAGLRWSRTATAPVAGGPIFLVEPALLADSLALFSDPLVDSLRRRGAPLQVLAPGAPLLADYEAATDPDAEPSTWARIGELDAGVPPGVPFVVIGRARAGSLGAVRPALARPVRWHELTSDSGARRVVAGWPGRNDSTVRLVERRSGWTARRFLETVPAEAYPNPQRRLSAPLPGAIVIVGDLRGFEARAVQAAFAAAATALFGAAPEILLRPSGAPLADAASPAWIVWLDAAPPPPPVAAAVANGTHLLEFPSPTAIVSLESGVIALGTSAIPPALSALRISRRTGSLAGAPILQDQRGDPVLTVERTGRGSHYRLATRPDPAWSDLGTGPGLPELAVFLLRNGTDPADDAPVGAGQATPVLLEAVAPVASAAVVPLRSAALWLACGLLLAERLLAHRRRSPA